MMRAFLLPLDQRDRLHEATAGPLADVDLSKLEAEAIPVVEVDGRIVAYWPIFYALHLEPLWVDPDQRGDAGVLRALLDLLQLAVVASGEPVAFAVIAPDAPSLPMAERLGFAPVPGNLYYAVQHPAPPVEV